MTEAVSTWPNRAHASLQRGLDRGSGLVLHRFRLFSITIAAVLVLLVVAALWNWVLEFVNPRTAEERTNLLSTSAQIVGGLILLLGLYFTARTYLVNREGQITERFSRAIDHLGKKELAIRLGGIYALERIARDSARDQPQIIEILTAFVRESSPVSEARWAVWSSLIPSYLPDRSDLRREALLDDDARVKPDVQAILTVLGRRQRGAERQEPMSLDLSHTDLHRASWQGAYLPSAVLGHCDLEKSWMEGADLSGALLNLTNLRKAILVNATLRGARVQNVVASGADFTEVDLRDAILHRSNFRGATFTRARLSDVSFAGCILDNANFEQAQLDGVQFLHASLKNTRFQGANLTNANLLAVDLRDCTGLTAEQVAAAWTNETTKLPLGLHPLSSS